MLPQSDPNDRKIRYQATGKVANERLSPLLPSAWSDVTNSNEGGIVPDFLWENGPRAETKSYRDHVKVHSHLPNGSNILDCKWALGRLFSDTTDESDPLLATLETHCFRGLDGFEVFCQKMKLSDDSSGNDDELENNLPTQFPDIIHDNNSDLVAPLPKGPSNLWVVKDAMSNGAGGVWVVGPENASTFCSQDTSPLYPEHRYVAQRYVWPPVLFEGRKCHVRVYGLLTSDGRAFVHHRAFLHVANDPFTTQGGSFQDSVHITNCCANSHDDSKFAGEILADFEQGDFTKRDGQTVVPLAKFFPSVKACFGTLAKRVFPFLHGGQANKGFEYLGMDFMLSYNDDKQPVVYMLEVNAPPSQDTATGLAHAENLHDDVIRDLITIWVIPNVIGPGTPEIPGGWRCVHSEETSCDQGGELIVPSKASILNKIRWAMFERKSVKREKERESSSKEKQTNETGNGTPEQYAKTLSSDTISAFARSQFPYFADPHHRCQPQVFFENAGGSQVAQPVIDAVSSSLTYRHRSVVGAKTKTAARETLRRILGAVDDSIFIGPNATFLLAALADKYVEYGLLSNTDEVVISTENHLANFDPWINASKASGAKVKLWTPFGHDPDTVTGMPSSAKLEDLINPNTRIVAIPHASNILGQIRDVKRLTRMIKKQSQGHAHVVVDGVAAVPHFYAEVNDLQADWYVISCHKLFGPHLGGLYGRRGGAVEQLSAAVGSASGDDLGVLSLLERGTVNYEACSGVIGLGVYFNSLASFSTEDGYISNSSSPGRKIASSQDDCFQSGGECEETYTKGTVKHVVSRDGVKEAYRRIRIAEESLLAALLKGLRRSKKVSIIEADKECLDCMARLPTVCFIHGSIEAGRIFSTCEENGIACRQSSFLCTEHLSRKFGFDYSEGIIRVSLVHYNTLQEIDFLLRTLESIPGW